MRSLMNEWVEHIKYGQGVITYENSGKITVNFNPQYGNKVFRYPDAFEQFLKFKDSSLQDESLELLRARKQEEAQEYQRKQEEYKRQEEIRKLEKLMLSKSGKKGVKMKKAGKALVKDAEMEEE